MAARNYLLTPLATRPSGAGRRHLLRGVAWLGAALAGLAAAQPATTPAATPTAPATTPAATRPGPAPAARPEASILAQPPAKDPTAPAAAGSDSAAATTQPGNALRVVLLLPTEQVLLRRAAGSVRDGAMAVFGGRKQDVVVIDCAYPVDGVVATYSRCVDDSVDWVIGPLSRADVTALAAAKLPVVRPTLMLSPLGASPPTPLAVLAPDLESEAEAITQQAGEDACRKPLVVEAAGPIANRVAVAMHAAWRERNAIAIQQTRLGSRESWRRAADGWRQEHVDCVLFAGGGAVLTELRPYLRNIAVYATSAAYETSLERTVDWTGVRIADAPWLIDAERAEFAGFAPAPTQTGTPDAAAVSPTLARLYALGVDAARLSLVAGREALPTAFDGAIGRLTLRDSQYRRTPMVGEFRERSLVRIGP